MGDNSVEDVNRPVSGIEYFHTRPDHIRAVVNQQLPDLRNVDLLEPKEQIPLLTRNLAMVSGLAEDLTEKFWTEGLLPLGPNTFQKVTTDLLHNPYDSIHAAGKSGAPHIEVEISKSERGTRITFMDNGTGFPPEMLTKPSDELVSTSKDEDRPFGGNGQALRTCTELISNHEGSITFHNNEDVPGATIILSFLRKVKVE